MKSNEFFKKFALEAYRNYCQAGGMSINDTDKYLNAFDLLDDDDQKRWLAVAKGFFIQLGVRDAETNELYVQP